MDDEEQEYGDEDIDDNNSQTGFSEYLVKGATITSAFPTADKADKSQN